MHLLYGLEYGTQKITTDAWIGLVHPDDRHKVFTFFNLLAHGEGGKEIIFRITKPDGTIRHLKSSGETEIDPEGNPKRMIGVNYDITEVIRQEEVIRQNENIFQAAFDHSAVGMSLTSLEGKYFKVNEALCRILGYDQEDLISKSFREISVPDDLEQNLQYFEQARKGERDTYEMEKRYYHKSGSIIWVYLNVSVVKDQEGTPLFFISQVQDITLRKTAETKIKEHLHELQRWHEATLGRENRIMDLKREVNILLQESGKPPRYFSVL
jgi:PAS domain S-box-containing protein